MSTIKDRSSLCRFTFADGRRCRTPRSGDHPNFCYDHAQKEARAQAAEILAKDLDYFFSGEYLSACDLSIALSRLIPAVLRGGIKPRTARTVAYLSQTLMQAIHMAQHEYVNAFGTAEWRKTIAKSVRQNFDYTHDAEPGPPKPQAPPTTAVSAAPSQPEPNPSGAGSQGSAAPLESSQPSDLDACAESALPQPESRQPASLDAAVVAQNSRAPQPAESHESAEPASENVRAALSFARSIFPRRQSASSSNSFNINIYDPSRNC
jgi:hypothetical protein